MKFLYLRTKFLNKFLIDGKKYKSFLLLKQLFQYLKLQNKYKFIIFNKFFKIIEPLFYIEKIVSLSRLTQYILFLPKKKKIRIILTLLQEMSKQHTRTKINTLSYFLSQEIYKSLFKTSYVYQAYKLQNETFLKLKNKSHYKWF